MHDHACTGGRGYARNHIGDCRGVPRYLGGGTAPNAISDTISVSSVTISNDKPPGLAITFASDLGVPLGLDTEGGLTSTGGATVTETGLVQDSTAIATFQYSDANGNVITEHISILFQSDPPPDIPEPAALGLFGLGLFGLVLTRSRRGPPDHTVPAFSGTPRSR
jgi:hypothetical protein